MTPNSTQAFEDGEYWKAHIETLGPQHPNGMITAVDNFKGLIEPALDLLADDKEIEE